jgi:ABC-type iron transport system FetAB ATPase subunit
MSRLRLVNLTHPTLRPVNLEVRSGECVCLSGPSGAGKSVLLRVIADLDPHDGEVYLDDVEARSVSAPDWRRQVGMLPADSHWWRDRAGEHFAQVDHEQLKQVGLDASILELRVSRLSTGERQRLALLRLLHNRPRALLLDEPTASLDPKSTRRVESLIAAYRHADGTPVIWVSHDPRQIKRVCTRRFTISDGVLSEVSKK